MAASLSSTLGASGGQAAATAARPKVFFSPDISGQSLKKLYGLINQGLSGKIAVKLHTGEPNGPYIINREMVQDLMSIIPGATIVETNVFYASPRQTTQGHLETLKTNGWTFAPVDIMDAEGDVNLPVPGGKWFKEIAMGRNLVNYDSMLVLTHFKGHTMGGFGGSLKNMAIGCASGQVGKKQLHQNGDNQWGHTEERFMENMAESGKAIVTHFGPKMAYINVLNNMSVDCDCTGVGPRRRLWPISALWPPPTFWPLNKLQSMRFMPGPRPSVSIWWKESSRARASGSFRLWMKWGWAPDSTN